MKKRKAKKSSSQMAPVTGVLSMDIFGRPRHLTRIGRRKMMYQDNPELPQEEFEEEVFDTENEAPPIGNEQPATQPDGDGELSLQEYLDDPVWYAQENKGTRKEIVVQEDMVAIDGKAVTPKELSQALQDAFVLFGPYTLAVDEYKEGSKKMIAISQAIQWKGASLLRTVTSVRLSAVREIYGFLVNKGQEDRVIMLETAKTTPEKSALENPRFFHFNKGYGS